MAGGYYNYYHTLLCSGMAGDNVGLVTPASRGDTVVVPSLVADLNCGMVSQVQPEL